MASVSLNETQNSTDHRAVKVKKGYSSASRLQKSVELALFNEV